MADQITLYTAKICPYAHRVEIALKEAQAEYSEFEVDLSNKPEWYAPKVNPASKVPAIAFGGPKVPPDAPSPESQKLAESLVLLEFVADLFPSSGLLPKDPVQRARVRFFIDAVSTKFSPGYMGAVRNGAFDSLYAGVEAIQALLPPEGKGKYAIGDQFTIADAAIAPFIARLHVALKNDAGAFAEGEGLKAYETLTKDPKYARYQKYVQDLEARDSFKATFQVDYVTESLKKRFLALRK